MLRAALLVAGLTFSALSCGDSTAPAVLDGTYLLVEENSDPLPSDPSAPYGCCLTLSGSLTFEAATYDRRYWAAFSPGIRLIRRESLSLEKADAERRFQAASLAPALVPTN
jgi:hypothetical protein